MYKNKLDEIDKPVSLNYFKYKSGIHEDTTELSGIVEIIITET